MVTLFYIKKEEDSLYFRYFIKIVDRDMCVIGLLRIELRKLKQEPFLLTNTFTYVTVIFKGGMCYEFFRRGRKSCMETSRGKM